MVLFEIANTPLTLLYTGKQIKSANCKEIASIYEMLNMMLLFKYFLKAGLKESMMKNVKFVAYFSLPKAIYIYECHPEWALESKWHLHCVLKHQPASMHRNGA